MNFLDEHKGIRIVLTALCVLIIGPVVVNKVFSLGNNGSNLGEATTFFVYISLLILWGAIVLITNVMRARKGNQTLNIDNKNIESNPENTKEKALDKIVSIISIVSLIIIALAIIFFILMNIFRL